VHGDVSLGGAFSVAPKVLGSSLTVRCGRRSLDVDVSPGQVP
jgi:hypothetical protein